MLAKIIISGKMKTARDDGAMKMLIGSVAISFFLAGASLQATDAPRGELLELHSCQLYIGGCIASAEATQDGRYLLRVWNFTGGSHQGAELRGLQVALLQVADQNLAVTGARPAESMVYLPQSATPAQLAAMIDWLKTINPELARRKVQTRTVPMEFACARSGDTFSAGDFLQVETRPFAPCGLISCGESLWYTPRSAMTSYTVAVTSKTVVREPALALQWIDHGKNNVFQGRFGEGTTSHATFAPPALVCAVADHPTHE
jgi:hypothetical protein